VTQDAVDALGDADGASTDVTGEPNAPGFPDAPDALGGDRPAAYTLPAEYDAARAWPLAILLHGFGASGALQDLYLGFSAEVDRSAFIAVVPDGTLNARDQRFWNGTDACCDDGRGVDDVGYVTGLIDEAATYFNVDTGRIYLLGHSNGGFLAHRIACDAGDRITGIMSLAGATWHRTEDCGATTPVAALQVHGTLDDTILYDGEGGGAFGAYPSAQTSAERS